MKIVLHIWHTNSTQAQKRANSRFGCSPLKSIGAEEETRTLTLLSTTPSMSSAKICKSLVCRGVQAVNHVFLYITYLTYLAFVTSLLINDLQIVLHRMNSKES